MSFYHRCVTTCSYRLKNGKTGRAICHSCSCTIGKDCGNGISQGKPSRRVFLLHLLSLPPQPLLPSPNNHNTCPCRTRRTDHSSHNLPIPTEYHLPTMPSRHLMTRLLRRLQLFMHEFRGNGQGRRILFHLDYNPPPREPNNNTIPDHWEFKCPFHSKQGCITLQTPYITKFLHSIRHNLSLKVETP